MRLIDGTTWRHTGHYMLAMIIFKLPFDKFGNTSPTKSNRLLVAPCMKGLLPSQNVTTIHPQIRNFQSNQAVRQTDTYRQTWVNTLSLGFTETLTTILNTELCTGKQISYGMKSIRKKTTQFFTVTQKIRTSVLHIKFMKFMK